MLPGKKNGSSKNFSAYISNQLQIKQENKTAIYTYNKKENAED